MGWFTRTHPADDGDRTTRPATPNVRPTPTKILVAAARSVHVEPDGTPPAAAPAMLHWLFGRSPAADAPLSAAERHALRALDSWVDNPAATSTAVPRARAVLPQLLAMLRRDDVSVTHLAQQVAHDGALAAEVLRLARAAAQGGQDTPPDLPQAVTRIGRSGLNSAIACVLLRPLFDAHGQGLLARASTRLWQHSEAKARQCSGLAFEGRIDPLEAYLGGLLHNSGWAVALNGLDRDGRFATGLASGPMGFSDAFAAALPDRCDRLFGRIAAGWALTPALSALADSALASDGLAGSHQPLAMLLRRADTATTALLAMPAAAHPT